MVVTITLNPAVDKSTSVAALIPEKKLRCDGVLVEAGGGGINVSKGIAKLGGKSLAIFPSGGANGRFIENYLKSQEIDFRCIPIEEETRESFSVTEEKTNSQFRFVLPGPGLQEDHVKACFQILTGLETKPDFIVASGSLPPGVSEDFYRQLANYSKEINARCIIDTSGKPLQLAVEAGVYMIKPNLNELAALAGKQRLELKEVDDAAIELIKKGKCEVIAVSLGASGALLVTRDGYEHIPAPTVKKNTTVGAGDSMVAGIVFKLMQGASIKETIQFGVACGTAATINAGTQLFNVEDVDRLFDWMIHHSEKHKITFE